MKNYDMKNYDIREKKKLLIYNLLQILYDKKNKKMVALDEKYINQSINSVVIKNCF